MQHSIIERLSRCKLETQIFHGYVVARHEANPHDTIIQIARDFINKFDLSDILDARSLQMNHMNFNKLIKEQTKCDNKKKRTPF